MRRKMQAFGLIPSAGARKHLLRVGQTVAQRVIANAVADEDHSAGSRGIAENDRLIGIAELVEHVEQHDIAAELHAVSRAPNVERYAVIAKRDRVRDHDLSLLVYDAHDRRAQ